ncbi:MAG: hypothetical protein GY804_06565 [Alphaproteobacteria bacterium]|nr:hypothetical protein [Alphaproteobacteria bacterium]
MGQVFVISDLHFGHKNIMNFAGDYRHGNDFIENIHYTVELWNKVVSKRDKVYVLGDVCFDEFWLGTMHEMNGRKVLIRGNHDDRIKTEKFLAYFESVEGMVRYKGYWLTHAPIHPAELRGKKNIHGHVHQNSILNGYNLADDRYINVCIENTGGAPISMERIKAGERGWYQWLDEGNARIKLRDQLKG